MKDGGYEVNQSTLKLLDVDTNLDLFEVPPPLLSISLLVDFELSIS